MARSRDKFHEAQFHLRQLQEEFRRYERNDGAALQRFQWLLAAFATSARSVTFALQREYRHAPGFDEWYAKVQRQLKEDETAALFVELRNVMQKEGNRLPMFRIKVGLTNGNTYDVMFDVSRKAFDRVVQMSVSLSPEAQELHGTTLRIPGVVTVDDIIECLEKCTETTKNEDFTKAEVIEREVILGNKIAPMRFPIFLSKCAEHLATLDAVVSEAECKFDDSRDQSER